MRTLLKGRGRRPRPIAPPVLSPYIPPSIFRRHAWLSIAGLLAASLLYGYAFVVYRPWLTLMLAPLAAIPVIAIWALPETGRPPLRALEVLFWTYFGALVVWPDYLAIAIPGLPWITFIRLVGGPMLLMLLLCLSVSRKFRADLWALLRKVSPISIGVLAFAILTFLSIGLSRDPGQTLSKALVGVLNWTTPFIVAVLIFSKPGRIVIFGRAMWIAAAFMCLIGVWEARRSQVPWAGHIPSFLKIEDPVVQRILAGGARAATGIYRVQSKFTTNLALGEFLALALPFILHIMFTTRSAVVRILTVLTVPLTCYIAIKTDSRLAITAFMMSILLYLLGWSVIRWRADNRSLFGPAITLTYPVIFSAFIAATFFVGRVRGLVWGTGAQTASTEARRAMYQMGVPMVIRNPVGHGLGQGAVTLGYTNGAGTLTIDTYYLAVALELGVVGFLLYYSLFIYAMARGCLATVQTRDPEILYMVPITIALINFVLSKSVFSQLENHPIAFMLLGATVALMARHQAARQPVPAARSAPALLSAQAA